MFTPKELTLDLEQTQSQSLFLMDARGSRLLFALSDQEIDPATTSVRHYSSSIFIYNAETEQIETVWTPEIEGDYQSGILTSDTTALCGVCLDPSGDNADTVVSLGAEQNIMAQVDGALDVPVRLGDPIAIFPYTEFESGEPVYHALSIQNNEIIGNDVWLTVPLAASSICYSQDQVCYITEIDGKSYFITADENGEQCKNEFDPAVEKLDSFCLTPNGVLASMVTDSSHKCVLFRPDGTRITLDRPGDDTAVYRLRANSMAALGVDYRFDLMAVVLQDDQLVVLDDICEEIVSAQAGSPISLRSPDSGTFYLFFSETGALYQVTTSYK